MTNELVCGIDSSTQATKVELRDAESGRPVATGRAPHPQASPPASEQSPEAWWDALRAALNQVADHLNAVAAVAVAGQQHGLVLVDDAGRSVRPAKLWNDTTSAEQAQSLVRGHGSAAWADAAGSVPVASFTVTKLAWVAQHEPQSLDRARLVMLPHDYLTWRLCGEHVTDRGDASGTGWWSPRRGEYDPALLGLAIGDPDPWIGKLPRVLGPREPAGRVTGAAAAELGLPPGALVTCGTGDNMAAGLGLGLTPGDVVMSLGTSGTLYAVSDTPTADDTGIVAGFADATGRYLPLVCTLNATRVIETIARLLDVDVQELGQLALDAQPTDDPLIVVPYLEGERTPDLPMASGLITGLRTTTSRADVARAAHVGVLCGLFAGVEALCESGVAVSGRRFLVGGGARSPAFQAFAAALWEGEVTVPSTDEAVATGACVQAAGVLTQRSFAEIAQRWALGEGRVVAPPDLLDPKLVRDAYSRAAEGAASLADGLPSG